MTSLRMFCAVAVALALGALTPGCSDNDDSGPSADAGIVDMSTDGASQLDTVLPSPDQQASDQQASDQHTPDLPAPDTLAAILEQEPNDGSSASDFNTITVPAAVQGAIGNADDADIFGLDVQAGDRLLVQVTSDGAMQAHLAVFDLAGNLPSAVNAGGPDADAMAEYYVLESGMLLIGVRDRRNVGDTSQHVGGPTFTYTLTVTPLSRAPIPITVGGQESGDLSPPGKVMVYAYSAIKDDALAVAVTPAAGSDLDARLSLFFVDQNKWIGTNDKLAQPDALLTLTTPFTGTYHAIVENVEPDPASLVFSISVAKQ